MSKWRGGIMRERITLISLFDKENLAKIDEMVRQLGDPLCKVPFSKNIVDRVSVDTLPYHFTFISMG